MVANVYATCHDVIPMAKLPTLAKEQRLAIASVTETVQMRGEYLCINHNLVGEERTILQGISYGSEQHVPDTFRCLRNNNMFSIVTVLGHLAHSDRQPPSTAVCNIAYGLRLYRVL